MRRLRGDGDDEAQDLAVSAGRRFRRGGRDPHRLVHGRAVPKFIYPVASGLIGGIGWGLFRAEESGAGEGRGAPRKLLIATAVGGVAAFVVFGAAFWAARAA